MFLKNQLLYGKHKSTIILDSEKYLLEEINKGVKISRSIEDSLIIGYNGYNFFIKEVTGNVYVNNLPINIGDTLEGSSVITLGHPNKGFSRKFATFDISHPEVVL